MNPKRSPVPTEDLETGLYIALRKTDPMKRNDRRLSELGHVVSGEEIHKSSPSAYTYVHTLDKEACWADPGR